MRLRILTTPPLPDVKAWFSTLPLDPSATVADFKTDICSRIQSLKDARIHADDIALVLDDFDLLNESSIDVVRDGDLISLKLLPGKPSTKRKALHDDSPSRTLKRVKCAKQNPLPRAGSCQMSREEAPSKSIPSSDSDSSSSDSGSSSSSESVSDSGTDPSSSLSSPPRPQPSQEIPISRRVVGKAIAAPLVPPGQGKHTTHSRNKRRRIKKQCERDGGQLRMPPVASSASNTQPLGLKRTAENKLQTVNGNTSMVSNPETTVMMSSLRNKNKKRGFRNSMANPLPPKITFNSVEEDPDPDPDTLLPPAATVSTSRADPSPLFPRLVPPSEKQANHTLPPHIFVTTVDVEEGLSSNRKNQQSHEIYTNEESWLDQEIVGVDKGTKNHLGLDFGPAEKRWESFVHVTALSQLEPGGIVGWKALAINPSTFTPEILLNLAVVVSCNGTEILVRPLHCPGVAQVSFGGILEQNGGTDHESYQWSDIASSQWRIVNMSS